MRAKRIILVLLALVMVLLLAACGAGNNNAPAGNGNNSNEAAAPIPDGVYTADHEKDPTVTKFSTLKFQEALSKKLKIMDLTAFALCEENNLPIYVFDMNRPGNLLRVVNGEPIGTEIC